MVQPTVIAIALAIGLVALQPVRIQARHFRAVSRSAFAIAAAAFWGTLAAVLISTSWSSYYGHFVPDWYRYAAPLGALLLYPLLALLLRWLSLRLPGSPGLTFCLLGGLESVPEHLVGIYRLQILDAPALQGTTAGAVLLFASFDYVFFWAVVLSLAFAVQGISRRIRPAPLPPTLAGRCRS